MGGVGATNDRETRIVGLNLVVQFCLEEIGVVEEDLSVMVDDKALVQWIQGKDAVAWSQRFLRNKARSMEDLFLNAKLVLRKQAFQELGQMVRTSENGTRSLDQMGSELGWKKHDMRPSLC
ncbi:hypothetical protein PIB30_067132 [Stylosanthes scabra]|uniref:Uncharacterized protein n=1 Tax=Stylosanthes scabra TaxID=79078 RepID=A0ABU6UPZ4_9FABA|nr:hypothetical protein [Stylosanthes scabra]